MPSKLPSICAIHDQRDTGGVCSCSDIVTELRAQLARYIPVVYAARRWRPGRDRDVVGTAPPGGMRTATGRALIDAIDAMQADETACVWPCASVMLPGAGVMPAAACNCGRVR